MLFSTTHEEKSSDPHPHIANARQYDCKSVNDPFRFRRLDLRRPSLEKSRPGLFDRPAPTYVVAKDPDTSSEVEWRAADPPERLFVRQDLRALITSSNET